MMSRRLNNDQRAETLLRPLDVGRPFDCVGKAGCVKSIVRLFEGLRDPWVVQFVVEQEMGAALLCCTVGSSRLRTPDLAEAIHNFEDMKCQVGGGPHYRAPHGGAHRAEWYVLFLAIRDRQQHTSRQLPGLYKTSAPLADIFDTYALPLELRREYPHVQPILALEKGFATKSRLICTTSVIVQLIPRPPRVIIAFHDNGKEPPPLLLVTPLYSATHRVLWCYGNWPLFVRMWLRVFVCGCFVQEIMPGGVSSPVRAFKSVGGNPIVFDRVKGAHIWDVDGWGNEKVTVLFQCDDIVRSHYYRSITSAARASLLFHQRSFTNGLTDNIINQIETLRHRHPVPFTGSFCRFR